MPRSKNAQIAVDLFDQILDQKKLDTVTAWKGIAELLLTCEIWGTKWDKFRDFVVYREVNDFRKAPPSGPLMQRAERLSQLLASELAVPLADLCGTIGKYCRVAHIREIQPHNPFGHAFRSLLVRSLQRFGDPEIVYEEEVDPRKEFPGFNFGTRSKRARIDIIGRRKGIPVVMVSSRWRFRHDRVDMVDEAMAYAPAARRQNPEAKFYAWLGEFSPARLLKVLENCPPAHTNAAISAAVHFNPVLIREGLGENGRIANLKDLAWLIDQSRSWH